MNKRVSKIVLLAFCAVLAFCLVGCVNDATENTVTVSFDLNGGRSDSIAPMTMEKGSELDFAKLKQPIAPEGYSFIGWEYDDAVYSATQTLTVEKDLTLKAVYRKKEFTVTFLNGDTVLSEEVYAYGELPAAPEVNEITLPQIVIVSESVQKVFRGWDKEVEPASANTEYNAVYEEEARTYRLSFTESEFAAFKTADGEELTEAVAEYEEEVHFTVALKTGVFQGAFQVTVGGGEEISAVNGVYTVTVKANSSVSVSGLRYVRYDTAVKGDSTVTVETNDANYGVAYGGAFEFKAKGNSGFENNAPVVKYLGEAVLPKEKDQNGMYVYRIENVTGTATLTVTGERNYVWVTYVLHDGSTMRQKWNNADMKSVAQSYTYLDKLQGNDQFKLDDINFDAATYYRPINKADEDTGWSSFYKVTTSDKTSDRVISAADAQTWKDSWKSGMQYVIPQEDTTYYIVYTAEAMLYNYDMVLPAGVSDIAVTINGEKGRYSDALDGALGYAYVITIPYLVGGDKITLSYNIPEGAHYQTYKNGERSVNADNGVYSFVAENKNALWTLDTTYLTVTLPEESPAYYLYNYTGNHFGEGTIQVPYGTDLGFYCVFQGKYTDIERDFDAYKRAITVSAGTWEYTETNYSGMAIKGYIRNITENTELIVTLPEDKPYELLFQVYDDFSYEVDGVPVVPEAGATTVKLSFFQSTSVLTLVPNAGYVLRNQSGGQPQWYYYYTKITDGTISQNYGMGGTADKNSNKCNFEFPYYSSDPALVEWDNAAATETQKINTIKYVAIKDYWSATQYTDRYNVAANGGQFAQDPATTVEKGGDYTVSLTAPTGMTPRFYIEYGSNPGNGFVEIDGVANGNNSFTFTVARASCDFRWYILLEKAKYDVIFQWGEERLELNLAYGTALDDISLPTRFDGFNDKGEAGWYQITGWRYADGDETIMVTQGGVVEAILGAFTPYAARVNETYYNTVGEAYASLSSYPGVCFFDVLTGAGALTLDATDYVVPKNVTLRLPYAAEGYGEKYGIETDKPSVLYVDESKGSVRLILPAGATMDVYGTLSVGGIVGYPTSAHPYQGHTSAEYAILQADGKLNIRSGGALIVNGFVQGAGEVEAFAGGTIASRFVVKDYRGGGNSSSVFDENIAPFNVYEMANVLIKTTINYGAREVALAMLVALGAYQATEVEVLGADGLIQPSAGGKIVKTTKKVVNTRYSDATKSYEPPYEYRIRLDVYGGGSDGVLNLMGLVDTKNLLMAISYIYEIHLHDGDYTLKNGYKIMPGGALVVEQGATLEILQEVGLLGALTAYSKEFKDNFGTYGFANKQLLYPVINEDGKLIVNGTLKMRGRLGADVLSAAVGAKIYVYSVSTFLSVEQREGIRLTTASEKPFEETYHKIVDATVNGSEKLESGKLYETAERDGAVVWVKK